MTLAWAVGLKVGTIRTWVALRGMSPHMAQNVPGEVLEVARSCKADPHEAAQSFLPDMVSVCLVH